MDRDTLYLDNDEEITSVVDKLKGTEKNSVDLVIPKDALLLQGVVNLKLLRKQAETLGKDITIVTQDKVGTKLAEQIGIPVVAKVGQVPKEVKMTEGETPSFSEEDIQMKEAPAEASKAVADDTLLDTEEVVAVATKERVEDLPKEEIREAVKKSKKAGWQKKAIVAGFLTLAIFAAAYIFVPLANVSLKIAAEKESVDISFKVDKNYEAVDGGAETIPGKLVEEEREVSGKYQATGKKKVGEKAKGLVTLVNHNYSTSSVPIVANTRVVTGSGLIFRTVTNASIPAYKKVGLSVTDGTTDVQVVADQVGDNYNIKAATTLSIPGLPGAVVADIYAKNPDAFTGGSSRDVTYVTQADVSKAKEEIGKNAEEEIRSAIAQKIEDGERLLEEAVKLEQTSATPSVAVNGEATEFELRANYKATAVVFKEDDLKKLAESVLGDKIGSTREIVESGSLLATTTFVDADYEKGVMNARLAGEAYIAEKLDQNKIKIDLTGEREESAKSYLSGLGGIDDVQIRFFPGFYKRMPRLKNHIYIKTEVIKTTAEE